MILLFGKFKIQFRNYISSIQLLLPILKPLPEPRGVKYYEENSVEKSRRKIRSVVKRVYSRKAVRVIDK